MKHFVAYHNTEKMGRPLHESEPFRLLTNKPVNHLLQQTVWIVTGEGDDPRRYSLGSVFPVTEVGDSIVDGFTRFATGSGHVFQPPVALNEQEWFRKLLQVTGRFGLGVLEIKDETIIAGLIRLAAEAGYKTD